MLSKFFAKMSKKIFINSEEALKGFIEQANLKENISREESINNLERNLVEISISTLGELSTSNGLFITDNGYFITAKHCVDKPLYGAYLFCKYDVKVESYSEWYHIKKICAVSHKSDLALGKAKKGWSGREFIRFRIHDFNSLTLHTPVRLITRKKGRILDYYGIVNEFFGKDRYRDHFGISIDARRGTSGGIVISQEGELMGFISTGIGGEYASVIRISKALDLIDFYIRNSR